MGSKTLHHLAEQITVTNTHVVVRLQKNTKSALTQSELFEFVFILRRLTSMQVDSIGRGKFSLPTGWDLLSLSNNSFN